MSADYPAIKDFFLLGKTLKSHGTSGQLRVLVDDSLQTYLQPGAFIFFNLDGSKVPFLIVSIEDHQHLVMTLEDIKGKDASDKLTAKEIWIPLEQVKPRHLKSPKNIRDKWSEYHIEDQQTQTRYPILRTEEYPQQLMAVISVKDREILIPLSDQLISEIDRKNKIINMFIPEGLLDL